MKKVKSLKQRRLLPNIVQNIVCNLNMLQQLKYQNRHTKKKGTKEIANGYFKQNSKF